MTKIDKVKEYSRIVTSMMISFMIVGGCLFVWHAAQPNQWLIAAQIGVVLVEAGLYLSILVAYFVYNDD